MPENFRIKRIKTEKGIGTILSYLSQDLLIFEHQRHLDSTPYLNFNLYIPSCKSLEDNVEPSMEFLNRLEARRLKGKGVRGFEQALKDAGEYYGTIFEGRKFGVTVMGWRGYYNVPDILFNAEEIKKRIQEENLDSITIKTASAQVLIDEYKKGTPRSVLRVDGFDVDIRDELSDLVLKTAATKVQESDIPYMKTYISQVLNEFKPVVALET